MCRRLIAISIFSWTSLVAQEGAAPTQKEEAVPTPRENVESTEFSLDSVIHLSVKNLKPPQWYPDIVSWDPAVSANSKEVQMHVSQGIALIHAGWDFEAYRHFVEAVKKDPECLMAYWGIALSLAGPNSEVVECRLAAVRRMIDLVTQGKGTVSEQGQAEAMAFVFSEQPERAPEVFAAVSEKYPNNLQLKLMASFLKRDGYDDLFGPRMGQREALEEEEEILKNNTESQMALSFWIALQAEHPDATGKVRKTVLPRVRRLVSYSPDFPTYCERMAHFEKRSGNLALAKIEYEKAIRIYNEKLAEDGLSYYDCPNLIRAKLALAHTLMSLDDFDGAFAIAKELSELEIKPERLYSPGATLVLWEGRTLGARLTLVRGLKSDLKRGLATLPKREEGEKLAFETPAVMAWESWRHALSCRDALAAEDFELAHNYLSALEVSDGLLGRVKSVVSSGSSRQVWLRTRKALKVEWMLSKSALIQAQMGEKSARESKFWAQSAIDERETPEGIFAPLSFSLPPLNKALLLSQLGDKEGAHESFKIAMADYANNIHILKSYEEFLRSDSQTESADKIKNHIQVLLKQS